MCAAIVLVTYVRRGAAGGDDRQSVFDTPGDARRGLLMLGVAVLCYIVWGNVGFIAMAVLLGPLSLLAMGIRQIWIYVTVLALTGVVYMIFTRLLGVQLP